MVNDKKPIEATEAQVIEIPQGEVDDVLDWLYNTVDDAFHAGRMDDVRAVLRLLTYERETLDLAVLVGGLSITMPHADDLRGERQPIVEAVWRRAMADRGEEHTRALLRGLVREEDIPLDGDVWRGTLNLSRFEMGENHPVAVTREGSRAQCWAWEMVTPKRWFGVTGGPFEVPILQAYAEAQRARADKFETAYRRRHAHTIEALDNGDHFADTAEGWRDRAIAAEARLSTLAVGLHEALGPRMNGGVICDVAVGACACGATHDGVDLVAMLRARGEDGEDRGGGAGVPQERRGGLLDEDGRGRAPCPGGRAVSLIDEISVVPCPSCGTPVESYPDAFGLLPTEEVDGQSFNHSMLVCKLRRELAAIDKALDDAGILPVDPGSTVERVVELCRRLRAAEGTSASPPLAETLTSARELFAGMPKHLPGVDPPPSRLVVLTAEEVRAAVEGKLLEIRRPVEPQPPEDVVDVTRIVRSTLPAEVGAFASRRPWWITKCPLGKPGDVLWAQESWRSWNDRHCDTYGAVASDDDHVCTPHCRQTYVAYEATPRVGYRPVPDKARITYLDESSPLDWDPRLLGPWTAAENMPEWASRFRWTIADVRCERGEGGWMWVVKLGEAEKGDG